MESYLILCLTDINKNTKAPISHPTSKMDSNILSPKYITKVKDE